MARVSSVHEYELRPGVEPAMFERAVRHAESRGLLRPAGLVAHRVVGIDRVVSRATSLWSKVRGQALVARTREPR